MAGIVALAGALCFAGGAGSAGSPSLELRDCPQPPFSGFPDQSLFPPEFDVECGTLAVPENRSAKKTRMIKIGVAIVHAPNGNPRSDPIVFMNGGPSVGTIQDFAYYYFYLGNAAFVQDRDLILVDTRGEGYSTPYLADPRLGCPELGDADHDTFFAQPYIGSGFGPRFDDALRACRARLVAAGVDVSAYNAAEIAGDLEALRKALNVRQWNLWGLSADGIASLTYMRLYPGGIRSAVLDSAQSTTMSMGPDYMLGRAALMEHVFAGCAETPACNAAYPHLRRVFYRKLDELQHHPQDVTVTFSDGRHIVVHVGGVDFWFIMLDSLYQQDIQAFMGRIWDAAHGALDQVVRDGFGPDAPGPDDFSFPDIFEAQGRTESYLCHDVVNLVTPSEYRKAAKELPYLAPEILSKYFNHPSGPAACAVWDNGKAEPAQHHPFTTKIPTLVTAGEFDLGVPPNIVRQIPAMFPHAFFYEFPAAFHLQLAAYLPYADCSQGIAGQFLSDPAHRPDSSCIAALPQVDYTP